MGWKAFCIFAYDKEGADLASIPPIDMSRTEEIRQRLGLSQFRYTGDTTYDVAIYPPSNTLFMGAYPKAVVICDLQLPVSFFDEKAQKKIGDPISKSDKFKSDVLTLFPQGHVLSIVLHSVVNLWGIALFSQGKFIRSVAGSADDGILSDSGTPLPEEHEVCEGRSLEEVNAYGDGEKLVFNVSRRIFGGRKIDEFQEISLMVRKYEKIATASVFKKLFG